MALERSESSNDLDGHLVEEMLTVPSIMFQKNSSIGGYTMQVLNSINTEKEGERSLNNSNNKTVAFDIKWDIKTHSFQPQEYPKSQNFFSSDTILTTSPKIQSHQDLNSEAIECRIEISPAFVTENTEGISATNEISESFCIFRANVQQLEKFVDSIRKLSKSIVAEKSLFAPYHFFLLHLGRTVTWETEPTNVSFARVSEFKHVFETLEELLEALKVTQGAKIDTIGKVNLQLAQSFLYLGQTDNSRKLAQKVVKDNSSEDTVQAAKRIIRQAIRFEQLLRMCTKKSAIVDPPAEVTSVLIKEIKEARTIAPYSLRAFRTHMGICFAGKIFAEIINTLALNQVTSIDKDLTIVYTRSLEYSGSSNKAITFLKEILSKHPNISWCRKEINRMIKLQKMKDLGDSFFEQGQHQAAIDIYTEALQADVKHTLYISQILSRRASARLLLGNEVDSINDLKKAIELNPGDREIQRRLNQASQQLLAKSQVHPVSCKGDANARFSDNQFTRIHSFFHKRNTQAPQDFVRAFEAQSRWEAEAKILPSDASSWLLSSPLPHGTERSPGEPSSLRAQPFVPTNASIPYSYAKYKAVKDYYRVLGLKPTLNASEIQSAYHQLAMQYHPDKNPSANKKIFHEIIEAYNVLSNPATARKHYNSLRPEFY